MKSATLLGKLYLIPTTMGDCDPMDVLPQDVKRTIDFIDYYIVENEKQLVNQSKKYIRKETIKFFFVLNKRTEVKNTKTS
jgi:16S rRNA (cytidine1402-2'-O)-methyltransferase